MKLTADTKLSEIEIPMLLMFVEEAFNVLVFQSGQIEPTALNWTIKELAKEANRSPEQSIEMLNHLIKEYQDYEEQFYNLYECGGLYISVYEDDPLNHIEKVI